MSLGTTMKHNGMTRREFFTIGATFAAGAATNKLMSGCPASTSKVEDPWQYYTLPYWGRRVMEDPPPCIVDKDKRLVVGWFREPIRSIDYLDAALFGSGLERFLNQLGLKEWHGYCVKHPEISFQFGLVDAFRTIGISQFTFYDHSTKQSFYYMGVAMGKAYQLAETTWDGHTYITSSRSYHLEYIHELDKARRHRVIVDIRGTRTKPAVRGELILHEDLVTIQPMIVSLPVRPLHHMYTHKTPLQVEGSIRVGQAEVIFDPKRDIALMDEHKSYYPSETYWNWATLAGYDKQGRLVALNLTDNRTFHDQRYWNENGIWLDASLEMIGAGHFDMDPERPMEQDWIIYEDQDRVNLCFSPECQWISNVYSLGFFNMNYYNILGTFNGYLKTAAGAKIELEDFWGVAETYHVWS